jgi:ubiquinone/menaquinone biosynthesis C-methylase UbiE
MMNELEQRAILDINQQAWDQVAPQFYGGTALPGYGPLAPTEETLGLLGNVQGLRVLEICCGSGHSLCYLAEHGAAALWGIDLSPTQLSFASALLQEKGITAHLFQSPMEQNPGIPEQYFDLVLSIYGLGWTTDLPGTLALIARYLKPGGVLVFSWEHPVYSCLSHQDGHYLLRRSYHQEGFRQHAGWRGAEAVVIPTRKISTFLNALADTGFSIERLVEEIDSTEATDEQHNPEAWYSVPRAQMMPTTFIIKARKAN